MSEQTPKVEKPENLYSEIFPYPKLIQTFNYFFPKEKDAPDIFTMENLRKFSRYAPYLALGILALIFIVWAKTMHVLITNENPPGEYGVYVLFDSLILVVIFLQYLWWLGASLFAKLVKRSPAIPLVMSFIDPLKTFGAVCVVHSIGFVIGGLVSIAK